MKHLLISVTLLAAAATVSAADVGVSLNIGQPGFYGQIDVGGYPPPQVIYRQPRAIYEVQDDRQPVYMRVPPGHSRNWRRHCGEYNACDQRVMFVRDNWYRNEYVPRHRERHSDRGDGNWGDRHDRHDEGRNYDRNR